MVPPAELPLPLPMVPPAELPLPLPMVPIGRVQALAIFFALPQKRTRTMTDYPS
jgi:hypothetical protein